MTTGLKVGRGEAREYTACRRDDDDDPTLAGIEYDVEGGDERESL